MRPVKKWLPRVQYQDEKENTPTIKALYNPYGDAAEPLMKNTGQYCSYCEVFDSNLQVEHVIPCKQIEDEFSNTGSLTKYHWENFLLGCARCNGKSCKTDTYVYLPQILLPHRNDTYHSLIYKESGEVFINPTLSAINQQKAQALIDLVKLNREIGEKPRDWRTRLRRTAWSLAAKQKEKYEKNASLEMLNNLVELATQRGFFSIWHTVFQDHPEVQAALRAAFLGTNEVYFQ